MRALALVALLAAGAGAAETRTVRDAAGRLEITVPVSWEDQAVAEGQLIHLYARQGGGHVLTVTREAGQAEVDKQRDRYMAHDAASHPGAEFQKIADPFFGYRMNDQAKNRVYLRAFLRDGADGLVATVSSRFHAYDTAYAAHTIAALGTFRLVAAAGPAAAPEAAPVPSRRIFDRSGLFSFVAPSEWKPITAEEGERLALGLKGASTTASLRVVEEGENDNPTLVLLTIQGRIKKDYAGAVAERAGTDPPTLLVKNRKEGWVDYMIAFAAGGRGYTLRLAAREGAFEGVRPVADAMAKSLVLMGSPYREPAGLPGDAFGDARKGLVVHAPVGDAAAAERIAREAAAFEKDWGKIAPAFRKGVALHAVLAKPEAFPEASHGFGDVPAAYDRLACAVVSVAPPDEREAQDRWRGRLFAALAEAALHRDLAVAPPPWLLAGLTACMEAAGRTGEGPAAKHFALLTPLDVEKPAPLSDVLAYAYSDVVAGETLSPLAMSWGYTHLMLFGKGPLRSAYAKWARELAKATKAAPPFDPGKPDAQAELKRHVERELRK
ncbi:MAG: hypothetical protein L6Q95_08885 [Planctomycetes bacterium]|nr:hypothetical protein [Planctomycetota bacterium]